MYNEGEAEGLSSAVMIVGKFTQTVVALTCALLSPWPQKRGYIAPTLGDGDNLDSFGLDAVEDQICAYWPEQDWVVG